MAIIDEFDYMPLANEEDPDDYRPDSELAIAIDPSRAPQEFVQGLTVFRERIAAGDRIPLHVHGVDEVFFLDEGDVEVRLGEERGRLPAGAVVFIPAGVPHGFENLGDGVARIHAVFPTSKISIRYLERNPAPGTEGNPPGPPLEYDVRELLEDNPADAVRILDAED
ncbi:MAG: cupin domain-containing protein [Gemmatimonadota bacterium]